MKNITNVGNAITIRSPFDGLQMPEALACQFFGFFARFEFVLKEEGFLEKGIPYASADWDRFAKDAATWLKIEEGSDVNAAISYLNEEPPQVQTPEFKWERKALGGKTATEKALHAVRRVRNNLFHGGKHTPHSPPGRDEQLVRCSLLLLTACLEQNDGLRATFEQSEF